MQFYLLWILFFFFFFTFGPSVINVAPPLTKHNPKLHNLKDPNRFSQNIKSEYIKKQNYPDAAICNLSLQVGLRSVINHQSSLSG